MPKKRINGSLGVLIKWWKVPVIFNEFEIKWEISCWGYFKIKKGIRNTEV